MVDKALDYKGADLPQASERAAPPLHLIAPPVCTAFHLQSPRQLHRISLDLPQRLAEEPAHVYWDNAGGGTSDAVVLHGLRQGARIVVCGQIAMCTPARPGARGIGSMRGCGCLAHAVGLPRQPSWRRRQRPAVPSAAAATSAGARGGTRYPAGAVPGARLPAALCLGAGCLRLLGP